MYLLPSTPKSLDSSDQLAVDANREKNHDTQTASYRNVGETDLVDMDIDYRLYEGLQENDPFGLSSNAQYDMNFQLWAD